MDELHATIGRLKADHEAILLKHAKEQNIALEMLDTALSEIARLKTLCGAAANSLEGQLLSLEEKQLVRDLRKAAE